MSPDRDSLPYGSSPGARWAQVFLFLLHIALEIGLVVLAIVFWRIQERVPFETWQKFLFFSVLLFSLVAFGVRGARLGADLRRVIGRRRTPPPGD